MKSTRPRKSTAKVKPVVGVAESEAPKESNEPGAAVAPSAEQMERKAPKESNKPGAAIAPSAEQMERKAPKESNELGAAIAPSAEHIRLRAYEIFVARGGTHGDDLADWFIAELELRKSRARSR
ncbi:MAG: DUF2934 domain-containing protein [Candidatus Binataceae bacterium]